MMTRTMILVDAFHNGVVLDTTKQEIVDLFNQDVDFCETYLADINLQEGVWVLVEGHPQREDEFREANFKETHAWIHGKRPFGNASLMLEMGTRREIPR